MVGLAARQVYSTRTQTRAKTAISLAVVQGLEVLSLSITSLEDYLCQAAEKNPLLDLEYCQDSVSFDELAVWDRRITHSEETSWSSAQHRIAGYQEVDFGRLTDATSYTESLHMHLVCQLHPVKGEASFRQECMRSLIECIDQDGYFRGSLPRLARQMGIELSQAQEVLAELQTFSPAGVGARTVSECLLLQLTGEEPYANYCRQILQDSMDDFANNRTTKLMRDYNLNLDQLREIKDVIHSLDPRPGAAFYQPDDTIYVIPDLSITRADNGFEVEVTDAVGVKLVLSNEYMHLLHSSTLQEDEVTWLEGYRTNAYNVLRNLRQRNRTLYRLGTYLVKAQYDFFRLGPDCLRPLTMQQAADALGVHVSTVSRTVQDKYVLTPWGCLPLKFFFCSGVDMIGTAGVSVCSSQTVKARIREIINQEDSVAPLSDVAITKKLNDEGIEIKRRTVAKYREALGIACQQKRRF